jgi:non-lysosomal glucosylceramidase
MIAWAAVPAITGFSYSGVTGIIRFAADAKPVKWFWSNGAAWGVFEQWEENGSYCANLSVHGGLVRVNQWVISGIGQNDFSPQRVLECGDRLIWETAGEPCGM